MRLYISYSKFSRDLAASSAKLSFGYFVCSIAFMNSDFSVPRKMSFGSGRISFSQMSAFHSGKALISAINVSMMQSLMISLGISLKCFSILAKM